jgi:chemotaxis protein methyltransferase CheR
MAKAISGTDTKKYSYFMQGYIEYHADNRTEAEAFFSNAESLSDDFWPAFFYHGMLLRDLGKIGPARSCFSKCRKIIMDFGNQNPYDFTLDSFSPSYISSLCETFSMGGAQ